MSDSFHENKFNFGSQWKKLSLNDTWKTADKRAKGGKQVEGIF